MRHSKFNEPMETIDVIMQYGEVETPLSWLFTLNGDTKEYWLPKSKVSFERNNGLRSKAVVVTMPLWLAKKNDLEDYAL